MWNPSCCMNREYLWGIGDELVGGCEVFGSRRGCEMNSRLIEVRNWPELAQAANYSVAILSQRCLVSTRQLERFFFENLGDSPHHWLGQLRMAHAVELLQSGWSVKKTGLTLGYGSEEHFSRAFKSWYGFPPSHLRLRPPTR